MPIDICFSLDNDEFLHSGTDHDTWQGLGTQEKTGAL